MTKEIAAKETKKSYSEVFFPPQPESSRLLVGSSRAEYAASRICRAVEDVDARVLNLNLTSLTSADADLVVALRVDHRNPERVARSLERYGYSILSVEGDSSADDTLSRRYNELMKYLSI